MKAVILAAGRGSRLKPLTDEQPKPFVKIVGVHLIESILDNLIKLGITEAVIAVGYLKEYFYSYLGSAYKTMQIQYVEVPEWETVNNSVTLLKTENAIGDDGFILVEGDEYFLDAFSSRKKAVQTEFAYCVDFFFFGGCFCFGFRFFYLVQNFFF